MHHARQGLEHEEVLLAHFQQYGNVFFPHHMAFAEDRPLALPRHDAGDVVTKHAAHGIAHINGFHGRRFRHGVSKALDMRQLSSQWFFTNISRVAGVLRKQSH